MNAYLYSMLMIFTNAGVFMMGKLGVFGSRADTFDSFLGIPADISPLWAIGVIAIAGALSLGTFKLVSTQITTAQGIAYIAFAAIFFGSFLAAFEIIVTIPLDAISLIFVPFFLGVNALIFTMALFQMATGGFKAHD